MYNFDEIIERRGTRSAKWGWYAPDVLPLWVADMDFRSPEPVIQALHRRVEHGVFGYEFNPADVKAIIIEYLAARYGWAVKPEAIIFLPTVVSGLNAVCRAVGAPGDGVLVQTPVYPPFLTAPGHFGQTVEAAELVAVRDGAALRYEIDYAVFKAAITPRTRLFILCNPHNPVGRVFTRAELEQMADICLKHDLMICADEIHCDLLFDGHRHLPLATLSPEIADRCITLMAPSKTYNIPGLGCSFAIVSNPDWRKRLEAAAEGIAGHPTVMGFEAAAAAYREGGPWLAAALAYLQANRDYVADYVAAHFPGAAVTRPEGTYLSWIDWRETGLTDPYQFLLEEARVALNDGRTFGQGGAGFTRLNFGCPRALLDEALERMRAAFARRG